MGLGHFLMKGKYPKFIMHIGLLICRWLCQLLGKYLYPTEYLYITQLYMFVGRRIPPERLTRREIFFKYYQINLKSDYIYHFPVDLAPRGRPFGSKLIGK